MVVNKLNTENLHQMIGARIKLLRIEKEKYQKDVADALTKDGIYLTEAQLLTYEKGKRKASSDVIIGLAKYFNVSTDYILCLTDNPGNTLFENSSITNLKLKKRVC